MASLLPFFILLAFMWSFCSAESRKELRNKEVNPETVIKLGHSIQSNRIDPSRVMQLSWRPRVFLYKGFLSDDECDHLISLAQGGKEMVVGNDDNSRMKRLRSSFETPLDTEDNIVARIEERISAWSFLPKENSRPLQVMHYGLEDAEHNFDYFGNKSTLDLSQSLMATVVLYLSNVTQGGEILFPDSELNGIFWSDCAKSSSTVRPIKGNAILFFTRQPNASPDPSSSHARCPILEGELWCAAKFFLVRATDGGKVSFESDSNECIDEDNSCPTWAALGECQKNPIYMIGSLDYYGTCRKSCNAC